MYRSTMKEHLPELAPLRLNISNDRVHVAPFTTWGPRVIPDTELIFIHQGIFALELGKKTVRAEENHLLVIFPHERHCLKCLKYPGVLSCIHCDLPEPEARNLPRVKNVHDPELADGFRRCAETFLHPSPWREELLQAMLTEIWIRIRPRELAPATNSLSPKTRQMIQYIRDHLNEPVSRSVLARQFHLSPQHVNHLFRSELGMTPTERLHHERVKQAFLLIQNEHLSVKEAADQTGFYDAYHFSKVFKKAYGFSPGKIRRFFKPR